MGNQLNNPPYEKPTYYITGSSMKCVVKNCYEEMFICLETWSFQQIYYHTMTGYVFIGVSLLCLVLNCKDISTEFASP